MQLFLYVFDLGMCVYQIGFRDEIKDYKIIYPIYHYKLICFWTYFLNPLDMLLTVRHEILTCFSYCDRCNWWIAAADFLLCHRLRPSG